MSHDELRALAEAATPGPWYCIIEDTIGGWAVANVDKPAHALGAEGDREVASFPNEADARLIAATRNELPALLDEIDALQADVEAAKRSILSYARRLDEVVQE